MANIKYVFLDMDGVICDFRGACKERNCIQGTKVDWKVVRSEGAAFWESIKWTPGGEQFFKDLSKLCEQEDIDLNILSAVRYSEGKNGKRNWLLKNTNIDRHHIHIVDDGIDKRIYATPDSVLIDDYKKNCDAFSAEKSDGTPGGQVIEYKNPAQAMNALTQLIGLSNA